MPSRKEKSWESFKPEGGKFEDRQRPTTGSKIFARLATLILGLFFALLATIGFMFFFMGFSTSRLIAFFGFRGSLGWFYNGLFLAGLVWAIWHWFQGWREESTTRERLDKQSQRGSIVPWKVRPPDPDDEDR